MATSELRDAELHITSCSHGAVLGRLGRQKEVYIDVYVKKFESNSDDTFPRLTESARFR
jgi:hypothetical protein